jgi:butyrate kinase
MAYQVAKSIGELATVVAGRVDVIVLTGGIAHSRLLTGWIAERVRFIAPVEIFAGENELESLALGILRVLNGQETALEYDLG